MRLNLRLRYLGRIITVKCMCRNNNIVHIISRCIKYFQLNILYGKSVGHHLNARNRDISVSVSWNSYRHLRIRLWLTGRHRILKWRSGNLNCLYASRFVGISFLYLSMRIPGVADCSGFFMFRFYVGSDSQVILGSLLPMRSFSHQLKWQYILSILNDHDDSNPA